MSQSTLPPPTPVVPTAAPPPLTLESSVPFVLFATTVIFLAHLPWLLKLGLQTWSKEHYQFFPLVIVGAAYLAYVRRDLFRDRSAPRTFLSVAFWGMTAATFGLGTWLNSPWLVGASAMGVLWSGTYSLGGRVWLFHLLPVWLFLLIALPLPSQLDFRLINWLQRNVSTWASETLDLMRYRHNIDGVDLSFPERSFKVEEACSGIHSLFAALCCAVFYLANGRRNFLRYLVLIPATVGWVLVANVLRILLVTVLRLKWNLPVDEGIGHDLLGTFVFVFSLAMIFSTDRLLQFVFPLRANEGPARDLPAGAAVRATVPWIPRFSVGRTCAVWLLILWFAAIGGTAFSRGNAMPSEFALDWGPDDFHRVAPATLQQNLGKWKYLDFQEVEREFANPLGMFSQRWAFHSQRVAATVSVDSPYPDWHDLGVCYRNIGWTIEHESDIASAVAGVLGQRTELQMSRTDGRKQYVLFAAFDSRNQPVAVPAMYRLQVTRRLWDELQRLKPGSSESANSAEGAVYQIQMLIEARTKLSDEELNSCRDLFAEVCRRIHSASRVPLESNRKE